MKTASVIAEYNPMHSGHIYLLNELKKKTDCNAFICILSSDFTQRGEPAVFDKYQRSEIAINAGFNLVVELPFCYSAQSAQLFAMGAIKIIKAIGEIEYIGFGAENEITNEVNEAIDILCEEPEEYKTILKKNISNGLSFAYSRQNALEEILKTNLDFIKNPNNILAIEYLVWLKKLNSKITALSILRKGSGYNDIKQTGIYPSATYLRDLLINEKNDEFLDLTPEIIKNKTKEVLKQSKIITLNDYFDEILSLLLTTDKDTLLNIPDMEKGLENRLLKEALNVKSVEDLIERTQNKRITKNRIRRILLYLLTGYTTVHRDLSKTTPLNYIHILAFDNKGREILKNIKTRGNVKTLLKYNKDMKKLSEEEKILFEKEIQISNLYESKTNKNYNKDFYTNAIYVNK